jgi:hypothetical protein
LAPDISEQILANIFKVKEYAVIVDDTITAKVLKLYYGNIFQE